ncbi:MAG TPA: 6-phosphofructokinase [Chloroflexia bacterium]|nr:6-phosphofructokinase [Chloroflexia bacterium]
MGDGAIRQIRKLGILTGGGDVPGLNAAIKAIVYRAEPLEIEVLGLRAGWEGITYLDRSRPREELIFRPEDEHTWRGGYLMPLDRLNTRSIDRTGGTILRATRTNPARAKVGDLPPHLASNGEGLGAEERVDLTAEVLRNIEFLGLDGLIVIGGDDTLSYGARLKAEGVRVWGIPKTMDNDVPGTDYCIGFQTAINRASESIDRIRSTAGSHGDTVIFRMFGRDAGFTALDTAIVTWADRLLIPEVPADISRLAELVESDRHNPSGYSIVVMSEGANLGVPVPEVGTADAYGHRKKANVAEFLAEQLSSKIPGVRFLPVDLTYILRSGEPDVYDKKMAVFYANLVMSLVGSRTHGVMAAHRSGEFIYTDIPGKDLSPRRVDPADYNAERYRPNFEHITGPYKGQP